MTACSQCACDGFHACDCPVASLGASDREVLAWMAATDGIKLRAIGVIGTALIELQDNECPITDCAKAAKHLIKAMTSANLLTFDGAELADFIDGIRAGRRASVEP